MIKTAGQVRHLPKYPRKDTAQDNLVLDLHVETVFTSVPGKGQVGGAEFVEFHGF